MVSQKALKQATQVLVDNFKPERIILFGSQASGLADDHSDVDLLVVCKIKGKRRAMMVEMDRSLHGIGFARDIIIITPDEFNRNSRIPGTIVRPARKYGKTLYERQ